MDETLEQMIKRHECRGGRPNLLMYLDTEGIETIGYGHNLRDKKISPKAAEQIFQDDLLDVQLEVSHAFPWYADLTEQRQWVIVDMCFNLGLTRLSKFVKFLKAMELGNYDTAANEMLDSLWAKQVKGRAIELANIIRGSQEA